MHPDNPDRMALKVRKEKPAMMDRLDQQVHRAFRANPAQEDLRLMLIRLMNPY